MAEQVGRPRKTIDDWIGEKRKNPEFANPPASRQHFDIWEFQKADGESTYRGSAWFSATRRAGAVA